MRARRTRFEAGVVLALTIVFARSAAAEWKFLGPAPNNNGDNGRVISVVAHPTENMFYLGGASGGVWKWQNNAYTPLTDRMPLGSIGALALDPKNSSIVYAGTGEPHAAPHAYYGTGIYKSTDGGATWAILASSVFGGRAISQIVVSPADTQVVYASVTHPGVGYSGVGARAAKGHAGYMGRGGVFRSADGGNTWAQLAGGLPAVDASDLAMAPGDPNTLYAAIGAASGDPANGIYKTTNGGDTWTRLDSALNGAGYTRIGIAPSNASRIYVAKSNSSVFVSSDAGATWRSTNPGSYMGSQGNYDNMVAVDPKNPDVAYFGGVQLLKTTNAGMSFESITGGHTDNQGVAFLPNGELVLVMDGGVERSTNGGDTWTKANVGLGVFQIYAGISLHSMNQEIILVGPQDNGTAVRPSATLTWRQVLGGDGGYTACHPKAPNVMFGETYGTTSLSKSTNSGQSFSGSASGIAGGDRNAFYNVVVFADSNDPNIVLVGTNRVYKSTNQGSSWTAISGDVTGGSGAIRAMAVAPTNPQNVWIATTSDQVSVSTDGGQTFTKKADAPGWVRTTRELSGAPWDDKVAFIATQRFGVEQVRMTKDLGNTWAGVDGDLPDLPANAVDAAVVAGKNMIFVGLDAGVYFTCNDGQHWARLGQTLPNVHVSDVRYDPFFKRVVVSTFGRGVWSIEEPTAADCNGPGAPDGGLTTGGTGGAGGAGGSGAGGAGAGGAGAGGMGTGGAGDTGGATSGSAGTSVAAGSGGNPAGAGGATGTGGSAVTTGAGGAPRTGVSGELDTGCACDIGAPGKRTVFGISLFGAGVALAMRRRKFGKRAA